MGGARLERKQPRISLIGTTACWRLVGWGRPTISAVGMKNRTLMSCTPFALFSMNSHHAPMASPTRTRSPSSRIVPATTAATPSMPQKSTMNSVGSRRKASRQVFAKLSSGISTTKTGCGMSPAGTTKSGLRRITLKSKRLEIRLGDIIF